MDPPRSISSSSSRSMSKRKQKPHDPEETHPPLVPSPHGQEVLTFILKECRKDLVGLAM
ncbi:hypothetical protein HMI55_005008, partial [Coelomomyces lativittatus]